MTGSRARKHARLNANQQLLGANNNMDSDSATQMGVYLSPWLLHANFGPKQRPNNELSVGRWRKQPTSCFVVLVVVVSAPKRANVRPSAAAFMGTGSRANHTGVSEQLDRPIKSPDDHTRTHTNCRLFLVANLLDAANFFR